jgi:lipopolysaccharide kinase (Kdo/WaaP) family protein
MVFCKSLHIDQSIRPFLAKIGISQFQDFVNYSVGKLVSRPSKRHVRTLYLDIAGEKRKYFLKQAGVQPIQLVLKAWSKFQLPCSDTARELLILELFRAHGIPVMSPVAWGECRVLGWSVRGFILVEEVVGKEFVEVYRDASLRSRRRLMRVHGELMGTLHQKGIESKVHPRDLICVSQDYSTFKKCLVVIDRERGLTRQMNISLKKRAKTLAEIWVKGAFTIGRGERSELLAFLSGYSMASGLHGLNKAGRVNLVGMIMGRATHILDRDQRYASLRPDFKEKYSFPFK